MKNMKKILLASLFTIALTGCKSNSNNGVSANGTGSGKDNPVVSTSDKKPETDVTLTGAYSSPAVLQYMNMRPTYNYYITTFSFQTLDTFSDNTYCLTVESTTYSGLTLPQEGNGAIGSERENFVMRYFGDFTSKANALDDSMLEITLKTPNRIIRNQDATCVADSADFKGYSYSAVGSVPAEYQTAEAFLKGFAFKETTVSVTTGTASFDYHTLENLDENASVKVENKGESILASYMSTGALFYLNMRPTYNYYMTIMNQQTLDFLDAEHYRFTIYSSDFSGLNLPEEGNEATGSERANYRLSFYGTYTQKANVLDETMKDVSLSTPSRVTLAYNSTYFVDSDVWNDAAKNATKVTDSETGNEKVYATGAEYLSTFHVSAKEITVSEETKSFDYLEYAAQMY